MREREREREREDSKSWVKTSTYKSVKFKIHGKEDKGGIREARN